MTSARPQAQFDLRRNSGQRHRLAAIPNLEGQRPYTTVVRVVPGGIRRSLKLRNGTGPHSALDGRTADRAYSGHARVLQIPLD